MDAITVDVWLYGPLAKYGGSDDAIFAQVAPALPGGSTLGALLAFLELPTEERGITFINGNLSAMPGLQPDLDQVLQEGDRIAIFHLKSMWPFQYRHEAAMTDAFRTAMTQREDQGLRSRYD